MIPLAALIAAYAGAAADGEPLCADRPGAANPSCTVPAGTVQVESGLASWSSDRSAGIRSEETAIGGTAVKLGITDGLHVEIGLPAYVRSRVRDGSLRETASGFTDSALAAKWRFTDGGSPVQAAFYPFLKLPTAKRSLGNGKAEGGLALLVDGQVGTTALGWNVAPQVGLVADADGSGYHLAMVQVASLGLPLSDRLSISADLSGNWDFGPEGTVREYAAGIAAAYLLSNDLQADAGIDIGLNRAAPDIGVYSGIAFRF